MKKSFNEMDKAGYVFDENNIGKTLCNTGVNLISILSDVKSICENNPLIEIGLSIIMNLIINYK